MTHEEFKQRLDKILKNYRKGHLAFPLSESRQAITDLFVEEVRSKIVELTDSDNLKNIYTITDNYGEASEAFIQEILDTIKPKEKG